MDRLTLPNDNERNLFNLDRADLELGNESLSLAVKFIKLLNSVLDGMFAAVVTEPAVGFVGEEDDVLRIMDRKDKRGGGWANSL